MTIGKILLNRYKDLYASLENGCNKQTAKFELDNLNEEFGSRVIDNPKINEDIISIAGRCVDLITNNHTLSKSTKPIKVTPTKDSKFSISSKIGLAFSALSAFYMGYSFKVSIAIGAGIKFGIDHLHSRFLNGATSSATTYKIGDNKRDLSVPEAGIPNGPAFGSKQYNNCFANSFIQYVNSSPVYRESIQALPLGHELYCLKEFLNELEFAKANNLKVAIIDTNKIRALLDIDIGTQEDAGELIPRLLAKVPSLNKNKFSMKFIKTFDENKLPNGADKVSVSCEKRDQGELFSVKLEGNRYSELSDLFAEVLHDTKENEGMRPKRNGFDVAYAQNVPLKSKTMIFSKPPKEINLDVCRTIRNIDGTTKKINRTLSADNQQIVINGKYFESLPDDHVVIYQITSFIQHKGASANNGHYMSYKKIKDQWYCYDDDIVTAASQADIKEAMKSGTIFHGDLKQIQKAFVKPSWSLPSFFSRSK